MIQEMARLLQGATAIEELYRIVGKFAPRLFPGSSGALCVIDSAGNGIDTAAIWGDSSTCSAARSAPVGMTSDPKSAFISDHVVRVGRYGQICTPISFQSEMLAFLHLQNGGKDSVEPFSDGALRLVQVVAEEIALSLANVGLREILRHQAFRDPLTGLYNRRFLHEALELEFHRAVRNCMSVAFVMVDVDGFKKVNDVYGHAAGDAVLQAVARILQSTFRASDVVCRYGGDEFCVVMPATSIEHAAMRSDECRAAVKLLSIESEGKNVTGITVSSGVAAFPNCTTSEILFRQADSALYSAKNSGSDRVHTSSLRL